MENINLPAGPEGDLASLSDPNVVEGGLTAKLEDNGSERAGF